MDIKRLNNGAAAWPRDAATEPAAAKPQADPAGDLGALPQGALDSVRAQFKRADLSTPKFESILRQSIDALLDSGSPMPSPVREKVSNFLAADPLFTSRVRVFWEKNLN